MASFFKSRYTQTNPATRPKLKPLARTWYAQYADPDGARRVPITVDMTVDPFIPAGLVSSPGHIEYKALAHHGRSHFPNTTPAATRPLRKPCDKLTVAAHFVIRPNSGLNQMDACKFWTEHNPLPALDVVKTLLGDNILLIKEDVKKGHHFILVVHKKEIVLSAVESQLRTSLDALDWQFITIGGMFPSFGIAPITRKTVSVAYHATRACVIPLILRDGLLPSNGERSTTGYADTEGVIHVCEKLTCEPGENDCAEWWMQHLSEHNIHDDPRWGIVQIEMARLENARVHQDMHSASGLVVDKVERIPKELIKVVCG